LHSFAVSCTAWSCILGVADFDKSLRDTRLDRVKRDVHRLGFVEELEVQIHWGVFLAALAARLPALARPSWKSSSSRPLASARLRFELLVMDLTPGALGLRQLESLDFQEFARRSCGRAKSVPSRTCSSRWPALHVDQA
jgi:hypothetical protein